MPDIAALLTEQQKTEIRRHLGYPEPSTGLNVGGPPYFESFGQSGAHIGDRYTPAFYDLEYRLISLSVTASVAILGGESTYFPQFSGAASALIVPTLVGQAVTPGETLNIVIAGVLVSYVLVAGDTPATIIAGIANAIATQSSGTVNLSGLIVAGPTSGALAVYSLASGPLGNAITVLAIGSPSVTFAVTDSLGNPATGLRGGSEPPGPRYVDSNTSLTIYGHLPIIRFWETAIAQSSDNFDTLVAGIYTADPAEYPKRRAAYISACKDMAQTLAIAYYGTTSYRGNQGLRRVY